MSESQTNETLYIKHAIGSRMLLDVSGTHKRFTLAESPRGWSFVIETVEPAAAELLTRYAADLNLFYFVEQPGQPIRKKWFYDKDIPQIQYDPGTGRLTIELDAMMEYNNEKV